MDPAPTPLRISESKLRLTVRDTPDALWLLGLGFVASGTLALSIPFYSPEWRHFALWEQAALRRFLGLRVVDETSAPHPETDD